MLNIVVDGVCRVWCVLLGDVCENLKRERKVDHKFCVYSWFNVLLKSRLNVWIRSTVFEVVSVSLRTAFGDV